MHGGFFAHFFAEKNNNNLLFPVIAGSVTERTECEACGATHHRGRKKRFFLRNFEDK